MRDKVIDADLGSKSRRFIKLRVEMRDKTRARGKVRTRPFVREMRNGRRRLSSSKSALTVVHSGSLKNERRDLSVSETSTRGVSPASARISLSEASSLFFSSR